LDAIKKKNNTDDAGIETSIQQRMEHLHNRTAITLKAPAKINISLVVLDRRDDGFHELHTTMGAVSLYDQLTFQTSRRMGIHLECTGRSVDTGPKNLVYQAAKLLAELYGVNPSVEIHLHKEIPIGAGLGGGSSDAAATLKGLNALWHLRLDQDKLHELACRLGSDVAFFLQDAPAICTGRGEIVQPIPHPCSQDVLLIIPDIHVSTKDIYHRHQIQSQRDKELMRRVRYFLRKGDLDGLLSQGINNLAETCLDHYQELSRLRERIEKMDIGPVRVSGSGSCMFVSSHYAETLQNWADRIREDQVASVQIVQFLNPNDSFVEVHHANL
jgi:4-diphosphocytidyl-2-C-methyl-D-erythritol kinase